MAVFAGCAALTAGAGSVLCAGLAGAAGGAVYGAMTCPEGPATARCVATAAVAGAAAGLTGGALASAGLGMAVVGAGGSFVNDGLSQLLTDGTIDPNRLAAATVAGGVLGGVFGAALKLKPFFGAASTAKPPVSNIAANQASGNAARDAIAAANPGSATEYPISTSLGMRFVDALTPAGTAVESKVGRTSLTSSIQLQIDKDVWALANSEEVTSLQWVFTRSNVTGLVGPTGPLAAALRAAGIPWR